MQDARGIDPEALPPSQRARRRRILDAALGLAQSGGFDAVQMREVSSAADVALGTLYRYFPSKEHLLVSALYEQIVDLHARVEARPPKGEAADRVVEVLVRATRGLFRNPNVASALIRGLVAADTSVAPEVARVREEMNAIILSAMGSDGASTEDVQTADLLEAVWFAALVSWMGGVRPPAEALRQIEVNVRRVLA